jgi:hypothetical protein
VADVWNPSKGGCFQAFFEYVCPRPEPKNAYSLDRYPNRAGNYEPGQLLLWHKVCIDKTMTLNQAKSAYLKGWTKLLPKH